MKGRSIILEGITISNRSVIGAGSLATKNIPTNVVTPGNPAKVNRKISFNSEFFQPYNN